MQKLISIIFLTLITIVNSFSQKDTIISVIININEIDSANSEYFIINYGKNIGLDTNTIAEIVDYDWKPVCKTKISELSENAAKFEFLNCDLSADNEYFLKIHLHIQKNKYRSIFFEFLTQNINFISISNETFYTFEKLYKSDSKLLETKILKKLERDIYYVGFFMKNQMPDTVISGGKYDGKRLFDVMQKTKVSDVKSFLAYIQEYPERYKNKIWKFSEMYGTGLVS